MIDKNTFDEHTLKAIEKLKNIDKTKIAKMTKGIFDDVDNDIGEIENTDNVGEK